MERAGSRIERIVDRKTVRNRVHYFVQWAGFDSENNTWESRVDLIADGYRAQIQEFERQRKDQDANVDSEPRGRGRSRSRSNSMSRGRSRSRSRSSSFSGPSTPKKTTRQAKPKAATTPRRRTRSTSRSRTVPQTEPKRKPAPLSEEDFDQPRGRRGPLQEGIPEESASSRSPAREKSRSHRHDDDQQEDEAGSERMREIHREDHEWEEMGFIPQQLGFLAVFLSITIIHFLPQEFAFKEVAHTLHPLLAPVVCLIIVLVSHNPNAVSKWMAILLVWRTVVEIIVFMYGPVSNLSFVSVLIASCALAAVVVVMNTEHPRGDPQALLAVALVAAIGILYSDIELLVEKRPTSTVRVLLAAVATMALSIISGRFQA